jgi:arsenate reductase-like glutaredoxin family protein
MPIQIFGTHKCPATRAAQRFFKERRVPVHYIDLGERNLSPGEFESVRRAVGLENMIDPEGREYKRLGLQYLRFDIGEKLKENPLLFRTPIVRNGQRAVAGLQPEAWKEFQET